MKIIKLNLPNLTSVGDCFLSCNENLASVSFPELTSVGNHFLFYSENLASVSFPNLASTGHFSFTITGYRFRFLFRAISSSYS